MSRLLWIFFSILCFNFSSQAKAESQAPTDCFNFNERVENLIIPPQIFANGLTKISGHKTKNLFWAAAKGESSRSLPTLLADLLTHRPTQSSSASKVEIKKLTDEKNETHDQTHFIVRPFPLVKVEWTEDWTFNHLKDPQKVLVSFEKTSGTGHIAHLCGQIMLAKKTDQLTSVEVYEEVEADRHDEKDTLSGVVHILENLRDGPTKQ